MLTYLEKSDHGGGLAAQIFARTQSLGDFGAYLRDTLDMGYLTLFLYEVMHEMVCIRYRAETDGGSDPKRMLLTTADIKNEHNNTLRCLLDHWKPNVGDSTCRSMKVSFTL